MVELDEAYTRRILGCKDLEQFYQKSSCAHVLDKINIPMIFVNSTDDPIVPPPLLNIIRKSVGESLTTVYTMYRIIMHTAGPKI